MRYRLRTLLILLALAPPALAGLWFAWQRHLEEKRNREIDELIELITTTVAPDTWKTDVKPAN